MGISEVATSDVFSVKSDMGAASVGDGKFFLDKGHLDTCYLMRIFLPIKVFSRLDQGSTNFKRLPNLILRSSSKVVIAQKSNFNSSMIILKQVHFFCYKSTVLSLL